MLLVDALVVRVRLSSALLATGSTGKGIARSWDC